MVDKDSGGYLSASTFEKIIAIEVGKFANLIAKIKRNQDFSPSDLIQRLLESSQMIDTLKSEDLDDSISHRLKDSHHKIDTLVVYIRSHSKELSQRLLFEPIALHQFQPLLEKLGEIYKGLLDLHSINSSK